MISAIKAEARKLLSVRSTYFIFAITLALMIFFLFYITGWRAAPADLHNPATLAVAIASAVNAVSIFAALAALLLFTHEYRYNTIMYTLTAANNRNKVLAAKVLVVSVFALVFTGVVILLSPLLVEIGLHAHHLTLVTQILPWHSLLWQCLFFGWGYSMAGLVLAGLIRNQVGAIITLFVGPSTIESLLGLLLKKNTVYLPFTALHNVIGQGRDITQGTITPVHAAYVFGAYLLGTWIVAWALFLRRDAN